MFNELIEFFKKQPNHRLEIEPGTLLFRQDETVQFLFIVIEGTIELTRVQENGNSIVLQRANSGSVLAEASLYSDSYHCDAIAVRSSILNRISKNVLRKQLENDKYLSNMWAAHLAREVQSSRYQVEILSRKTVAEKLDGWLTWHDGMLPKKGTWKAIAAQIGVTPEALYRELAKRK